MKFNVVLYPIALVKVPDVEANTPEEAILKAEALIEEQGGGLAAVLRREFRDDHPISAVEYADQMDSFLVDVLNPAGEIAESIDFAADGVTRARTQNDGFQEHPTFTREAWQQEVTEGNTRLGYADWILHQREADAT